MSDVTSLLQGNKLIEVDENGQIEQPVLVLSSRGGDKIGAIQNVSNINVTHPLADVAELSFDVTKEIDGETYADWDKIKDFKFVQMPYDNTWFEATVSIDEENEIIKHVTCTHANEAELGQLNLYDTEINTESDIERDDYEETYFYNEENPKASLLNRILKDKAPHYQIYHVDDSLKGLFRVFSFNGDSIQDALNKIAEEVNCLFIYGEWDENDGKYHRTISAYDLEDYCQDCHTRGEYTNHVCTNCGSSNIVDGYGEDTGIFISKENLAKSINYSSNTDNVKNCFRLVAGDDTMTSAIKSCNPSMSQYIWHFSDDMLEDMGEELTPKITEYEALVAEYRNRKQIRISDEFVNFYYNSLVDKYGSINKDLVKIDVPIMGTEKLTEAYYNALNMYGFLKSEMMPLSDKVDDTSATQQLALLQSGDFTEVGIASVSGTIPYTTANSAIQSYAKVFIDTARYKVGVFTNSINGTLWNGEVTITSYSNDEDTATGTFTITLFDNTDNEKYTDWLEQSVQKTMASREATDISVVNLFKRNEDIASFKERLKWYSLDYLNIMSSMATSAITVMSEQGVANQDSLDTDVYAELYLPYLEKSRAIQDEIKTKEEELSGLLQPVDENGVQDPEYQSVGLIDVIIDRQNEIRDALDLHNYLGDELWERLSYYRRESEYSNQNYVSDGLTDSEVIKQAKDFVDVATKEIIKAATLQHTISAPLANFLLMDEFSDLQEKFKVGNWIWLQVDGKVYKLRLANWEIDYDNIDDLDIEFTDVVRVGDIISDVESILSKSKSMSTTYDYTARQADKGKDAAVTVKFFKDSGIDFSKVKAITSKGNTNIVYDDDGILLKRVDVFDESPEQARIYNNGIYITRDAWETVSTGLGHFSYVDPETGENVETYGIIADTVIGKLILGENLKIYSESGKFEMGDDGLKVTAIDGEDNSDLFVIQKQKTDDQGRPYVEKYIYVDSNGDVKIAGNSITIGAKPLTEYIADEVDEVVGDQIDDARKVATNYLSADSTGIMVADMEDGEQTPSTATGKNVFIDNDSVDIRNGQTVLSSFGNGIVTLGEADKARLELTTGSIKGISNQGVVNFDITGQNIDGDGTINDSGVLANQATDEDRENGILFKATFRPNLNLNNYDSLTGSINFIFNNNERTYNFSYDVPDTEPWAIVIPHEEVFSSIAHYKYGVDMIGSYYTFTFVDLGSQIDIIVDDTVSYNISITSTDYHDSSFSFGSRATSLLDDYSVGSNSCIIGEELVATSANQVAIGRYNYDNTEKYPNELNRRYAFMVGNGFLGAGRNNAFAVDWNGRVETGDIKATGLLLEENSKSEMDDYIKCVSAGDADIFKVNKNGVVNTTGAIKAPNTILRKPSSESGDYLLCEDENRNSKFRVLHDGGVIVGNDLVVNGAQTTKGTLKAEGVFNVLGKMQGAGNPLFKVVTRTIDNISMGANGSAYPSVAVNESGYTPIAINSITLGSASSGGTTYGYSVVQSFGINGQTLNFYVGNWNTSSAAKIKMTIKVLCIRTSAL